MKAVQGWSLILIGASLTTVVSLVPFKTVANPTAPASLGLKDNAGAIAQTTTNAPTITTSSSFAAIALAKHLKSVGAKMYGAYWCPHCHEQLQLFGREAARQLPYIECAEDGKNARPDLCNTAKVEGYPTWKIKGKTYLGVQPLEQLAIASGYKGLRNFK